MEGDVGVWTPGCFSKKDLFMNHCTFLPVSACLKWQLAQLGPLFLQFACG